MYILILIFIINIFFPQNSLKKASEEAFEEANNIKTMRAKEYRIKPDLMNKTENRYPSEK